MRITNHSGSRASYAVRIDFTDSSGKTVESTVVGVRDLEPGRTATLLAFGSTATRTPTTPKVAQAQRT
ncbi:hypothetical protein C7M71_013060 [Peterkaempfera bronchialis]|uniref:Uncharacterized protein n=1 Tax=Peterkaempfera bronchialis TaxID=2126346 RepID=A0A345SWX9_9ACTN|nr:hypothetical protein C7M71_013060 [Peterkaempfera bronchialis]